MNWKLLFLIGAVAAFFSCTKVIQLDLKDTEARLVIEGIITNEPGTCKVFVTKSKNFNENNQFERVSGALVKIDDNGVPVMLTESGPGVYETNQLTGEPGHTYQLSVNVDGQTFTASSTMPQPVKMDSLYISKGPFGEFNFATIAYIDPAGINNGYRFILYVNDVKEPAIFWENDEFTDGQMISVQLDTSPDDKNDPRNIKSGDKVMVEMLCLDDPVYKYWYSLRTGGGDGDGDTAAPANPLTNIRGGALGYFSAHTINRKTVIAP